MPAWLPALLKKAHSGHAGSPKAHIVWPALSARTHSERAGLLLAHLALQGLLSMLLQRNSLRACRPASGALRAARAVARKLTLSVPAQFQRTLRCQRSRQEVHSERVGSLLVQFALPALLQGSSLRPCQLISRCQRCRQETHCERAGSFPAHFALPALLQGNPLRACRLAIDAQRVASKVGKKLTLSVLSRLRCTSDCQRYCQKTHSERACSLKAHIALPTLSAETSSMLAQFRSRRAAEIAARKSHQPFRARVV